MSNDQQKIKLTVSGIQQDLRDGLDREAIGKKYNLKKVEIKELFQHPKLKGLKVKIPLNFTLEDDTADGTATATAKPTQTQAKAPAAEKKTKTKATAPQVQVEDDTEGEKEEETTDTSNGAAIKEVKEEAAPEAKKGLW